MRKKPTKQDRSQLVVIASWEGQEYDEDNEVVLEVTKHTAFRKGAVIGYESETIVVNNKTKKRRKKK